MNNKLCFVAKRNDGLGERMRAFVNAFALSRVYGGDFKFFWEGHRSDLDILVHSTDEKEIIFSPSFIEKHHVNLDCIKLAKPVNVFFESFNDGIYFCNQDIPRSLFKGKDDIFFKFREELSDAFDCINFADSINSVFEAVNRIELSNNTVALHLRAGDMIYGDYKSVLGWQNKAISFPVAFNLIEELVSSGKRVMVFGQDIELIKNLSTKKNVSFSHDFVPDGLTRTEVAFFDISLMGRCCSIYGGDSGFAIISATIAKIDFIRHNHWYSNKQSTSMILNELMSVNNLACISIQQKVYACKVAYVNGGSDLLMEDYVKLFLLGKKLAPEDVFFDFMELLYYLKTSLISKAKIIAEHIVQQKKECFRELVLQNSTTPHTTSVFLKLIDDNKLNKASRESAAILDIFNILTTIKK
jgi:hypothetical protein